MLRRRASTGQLRPQAKGKPKRVNLPPAMAGQLAWYRVQRRRWSILARWGRAAGTALQPSVPMGGRSTLLPSPWRSAKLLEHKDWKGFTGPAIQLSGSDGETSGRFEVAQVVARRFSGAPRLCSYDHQGRLRSRLRLSIRPFPLRPASPTKARNSSSSATPAAATWRSAQCTWLIAFRPDPSPVSLCSASAQYVDTELLHMMV